VTTQIEARVPGKVIEVDVKDDRFVKKGDVLFRMDPQPYADQLHHAQAAYAESEIRTSTAILQDTQTVNSATAQTQALQAEISATQAAIGATQSQLNLAKTRLKEYTELKSKNAGSLFEVEKYETDVKALTDQVLARRTSRWPPRNNNWLPPRPNWFRHKRHSRKPSRSNRKSWRQRRLKLPAPSGVWTKPP
jgi:multidrug resistance efflux pump